MKRKKKERRRKERDTDEKRQIKKKKNKRGKRKKGVEYGRKVKHRDENGRIGSNIEDLHEKKSET